MDWARHTAAVIRGVAFLAAAALATATLLAVVRAPKLQCQSLELDRCVAAAGAIIAQARPGPSVVAIGLVGYRGCFPGPVYCPLIPNNAIGSLSAVAGVKYADGRRKAFYLWLLDTHGGPSVAPMQADLVDYSLALVFPSR
jgi:hydrogenase/urease accessory protein HupE